MMINHIRIKKSNVFSKRRKNGLGCVTLGKIPAERGPTTKISLEGKNENQDLFK